MRNFYLVLVGGCLTLRLLACSFVASSEPLGTHSNPSVEGKGKSESAGKPVPMVAHDPYADESCDACHTSEKPNGEDLASQPPELCYDCHDEYTNPYLHSPVSIGDCTLCHNPHESPNEHLLREKVPTLCFMCHTRLQEVMTDEKNVKHKPAEDRCTACHTPHGSDVGTSLLRKEPKKLCAECHESVSLPMNAWIAQATKKHAPVEDALSCANCHSPHASPFEFHLRAMPMDLCMTCHDKPQRAFDGKMLMNMEELLRNNPDHHGPIRKKNCSGCHNPHGSKNFRLLKHAYPERFYTDRFDVEDYALCFSCHDRKMVLEPQTTTLTRFRDGARNLHYLHVHRRTKGRTCRACHETHASKHPHHIRDSVPFGKIQWPLKLDYQEVFQEREGGRRCEKEGGTCIRTGGSCIGCHKRKTYDFYHLEGGKSGKTQGGGKG
ncbi:MAG: hypothetical protein D6795_01335 [Deltaproteobacteria bacterium]|nr:MAG: hypothetical protein D6795_01335 [Deltaproteobacteria bacterium]